MNTLKDRTWLRVGAGGGEGSWAQTCAGLGSVGWAAIAILARVGVAPMGATELIFLFAPLVIVPLGMELVRVMGPAGRIDLVARKFQPVAAGLAVISFWLPPGKAAGGFALVWLFLCALLGFGGVADFASGFFNEPAAQIPTSGNIGRSPRLRPGRERGTRFLDADRLAGFAIVVAKLDLVVGGAWFVASRLGSRPMGIQEPIGLLTAVHFHFAAFATALIAAATLQFARSIAAERWLRWCVLAVVGLPYVVGVGFLVSPLAKMVAGVAFSVAVAALALFLRSSGKTARDSTARILLQIAPACVFAGMVLAGAYAIADFLGSDVLPIPQMARTHGVLNAVGFCMCGLLGWLIEFN